MAAPEHIEGRPKEEVGQHVEVDARLPLPIQQDVALVLRPALHLTPATCIHIIAKPLKPLKRLSLYAL